MMRYSWKNAPNLTGVGALFGPEGAERLVYDDPEEVADAVLDDSDTPLPADWTCEVHVYHCKAVDPRYVDSVAASLIEQYREMWAEEYGDPDGDAGSADNGEDEAALLAWVRGCVERSIPWQHERTGDVIVYDAEWARQRRDDHNIDEECVPPPTGYKE